jgi:hypothetical protein
MLFSGAPLRAGASMEKRMSWKAVALAVALTFILACASATFFLQVRCTGKGRTFGPSSWRWAVMIIGVTSVLSAGGAVVLAVLGRLVPAVILSLGIAAPGTLCLEKIKEGIPERRSTSAAAATLWLSWMLQRLHEGMAEDKREWCERHIDHAWHADVLILAAHFYHDYLNEHLSDEDRKRFRIRILLQDIEARLDIARMIDAHAARSKVVAAFNKSRVSKEIRYQRNLDDLSRLCARLEHDARRDLERLLAAAYVSGLYRLERYNPVRGLPRAPAEQSGSPRWHP